MSSRPSLPVPTSAASVSDSETPATVSDCRAPLAVSVARRRPAGRRPRQARVRGRARGRRRRRTRPRTCGPEYRTTPSSRRSRPRRSRAFGVPTRRSHSGYTTGSASRGGGHTPYRPTLASLSNRSCPDPSESRPSRSVRGRSRHTAGRPLRGVSRTTHTAIPRSRLRLSAIKIWGAVGRLCASGRPTQHSTYVTKTVSSGAT